MNQPTMLQLAMALETEKRAQLHELAVVSLVHYSIHQKVGALCKCAPCTRLHGLFTHACEEQDKANCASCRYGPTAIAMNLSWGLGGPKHLSARALWVPAPGSLVFEALVGIFWICLRMFCEGLLGFLFSLVSIRCCWHPGFSSARRRRWSCLSNFRFSLFRGLGVRSQLGSVLISRVPTACRCCRMGMCKAEGGRAWLCSSRSVCKRIGLYKCCRAATDWVSQLSA